MNLIDAIKSGRRFKRKVWPHYPAENTFCPNDIIADDWEVEEGPVTITREKFNAAWDNSLRNEPQNNWELHAFLIRHLGL